ncbi:MAG: hypothetical protein ABJA85_05915, partial [Bacteroidota bacterium]
VSGDSAYRRIRGETPLVLEEARLLCDHFNLSLDKMLDVKNDSILFQNVRIDNKQYSYEKYLAGLTATLQQFSDFFHKEMVYLTKDLPLFHNFYYSPLIAFRYFFWMKSILQHPDFTGHEFEFSCLSTETEAMSRQLTKAYTMIPSVEIWNTECVNSTISQVEFYKDSGLFSSAADIRTVYDAFEETILHLQAQAEHGCKFMPGENPQTKKANFRFFYNRVILGDNTIFVKADHMKAVYLNYDVLNYITTQDEAFCNGCEQDLQNLMRKATLISQTSEKQRNIFFNILLNKIQDRKRNL